MTATRGRPPIGPRLTFRLDEALRAELDAEAQEEEVPVAEMVRRILTDRYYEEEEQ